MLAALIPGGPIENRDFSHIHPAILGGFNIFLTALDFGSLVLVYFVIRRRAWAFSAAFVAAISYFAVYAIDLAQLFPRSPTPMSFALSSIEVLGMTVAVPLMFATRRALVAAPPARVVKNAPRHVMLAIAAALLAVGLAVVWFATNSAMNASASAMECQRDAASATRQTGDV